MPDRSPIEELLIAVARPDAHEDSPERKAAWDEIKRRDRALLDAEAALNSITRVAPDRMGGDYAQRLAREALAALRGNGA